MRTFKLLSFLLAAIMICLSFSSCGEDYKDAFIYIDFESTPTCLDPQLADTNEEFTVVRSIFDTLLRYDSKGNIVPSAAQHYNKTGNSYVFSLRKDAKWVEGESVTAHDYVFAFRRAVDPATKAPYANSLFSIVGAEEINLSGADISTLGVTALDDYTLKIDLKRQDSEFEKVLTTAVTMPCNEKYFNDCKGKYGLTLDTTPANGSYYVRKWTTESKFLIRLAKNLDYTGEFEANSMRIYYTCGSEDALSMLEHDNTDLIYISQAEYSSIIEKNYEIMTIENSCYTLFVNGKIDEEFRKALLGTINQDTFKNSLAPYQKIADNLYPAILQTNNPPKVGSTIKYDPNTSATLYNDKMVSGGSLEGVTITYPADDTSRAVAKAVAAHWQQKLSCFINISESSRESISASFFGDYYDIIIIPFTAPIGTLSAYNAKLGFGLDNSPSASQQLYTEYRCYPLFFSSLNVGAGTKIKNLKTSSHGGIIDVSMLIKEQ